MSTLSGGAWEAMVSHELERDGDVIRKVPGVPSSAPAEPVTFSSQAGLASIRRPNLRFSRQ
jgi:hypothetical protein